ncbi:M4 family metallopeptidase [Lysobacter sp. A6]|uniref:Neutral metalloproteinase n=1 Tax=Noviluteimonas lactosilytica TaxID=2888523 RepID=A0ABS8JF86_9GAMM|nr:M4 family metallopeptidase [Lysobacter lactosilyticus]MCC8362200.1 M4 family metallopeptidase [Lysobacter lactosilyticus]
MSHSHRPLVFAIALALTAGAAHAGKADHPAAGRALGLADSHAKALNKNAGDSLVVKDVMVDADGTEHVRFERTYRGLPVLFGDVVVHSRNGQFRSASQTLKSSLRPNLDAKIRGDEATVIAGADFGIAFDGVREARKVVYARGASPVLAYEVVFTGTKRDQTPTEMHYFVDAGSGRILDKWDMVHTAKPGGGGTPGGTPAVGTGRTLLYGNVALNTASSGGSFNLTDTTRGNGATYDAKGAAYNVAAGRATLFTDADNTWGNNTTSDRATVASDAHFGVATTFDYYKVTHGRNGIFNDGKGVKSYVHVGRNWANAAWYANAMYYGDGGGSVLPLVAIDVAGHEMSHGVTQATSALAYSGDAGGLNEATSDIFGTMVEFYANNGSDTPDWKIGEEIYASNPGETKAIRYMFKPSAADGGASYDCYPAAGFGGVDPHYSSGPANHFFYLLSQGATNPSGFNYALSALVCNGDTGVTGIGRSAAERIWYRALDLYFTSGTTYPQARAHTLRAASDLFGSTSAQYAAVARAWSAVGVN